MPLPTVKHPTFTVAIPSTKKKIKFRPFTVKEEKILLMAKESKDEDSVINAIKQVLSNCIYDKIDVEDLATFDVEYLVIKLRAKSVGEMVDLMFEVGGEKVPVNVNLDEVEIKFPDNKTKNKFMISDQYGVTLRYPKMSDVKELTQTGSDVLFKLVCKNIVNVYDNDTVYDEFTQDEMEEFIASMPSSALEKLIEFFQNLPRLEHEVTVTNSKGVEQKIVLRGLLDFFTL